MLEGAQAEGRRAAVVVAPRDREGGARGGDDGGAVDAAPHGVQVVLARSRAQNVMRAAAVQRVDLVDADADERRDGGQAVEGSGGAREDVEDAARAQRAWARLTRPRWS